MANVPKKSAPAEMGTRQRSNMVRGGVLGVGIGIGRVLGRAVGLEPVGRSEGLTEGRRVGKSVGWYVGRTEGRRVGKTVGKSVGRSEGRSVGNTVGRLVGKTVGRSEGRRVGNTVGRLVGKTVGKTVGKLEHTGYCGDLELFGIGGKGLRKQLEKLPPTTSTAIPSHAVEEAALVHGPTFTGTAIAHPMAFMRGSTMAALCDGLLNHAAATEAGVLAPYAATSNPADVYEDGVNSLGLLNMHG